MSAYLRIIAAIFSFVIGVSAVWAIGMVTAGVGVLGVPFMSSQVIEVAAPPVPEPSAKRFKHRKNHDHRCGKFADSRVR